MIPFPVLLLTRALLGIFFLLTAAYALLNCSPFAFDMFIRPQLFPWLTEFVAWHHLWFAAAWAVSVVALAPQLDWRTRRSGADRLAHRFAIAYVAVGAIVAAQLLTDPLLPALWNDSRALPTALAALVPLLWLALIDHLVASGRGGAPAYQVISQVRLLATCAGAAAYLWGFHVMRAWLLDDGAGSPLAWAITAIWSLTLVAAVFAMIYALLSLVAAIAVRARSPVHVERALTVIVLAVGIGEFLRRVVLPTVSIGGTDAAAASAAAGIALAATWSGLATRRAAARDDRAASALEILFGQDTRRVPTAIALVALPPIAFAAIGTMERLDWAFVVQRTLVLVEFLVAFGLLLRVTAGVADRGYSARRAVLAPAAVLAALLGIPPAVSLIAAETGNLALEPAVAFERGPADEVAFSLLADALVRRPGFDADYYRFLQAHADATGRSSVTVPAVDFRPSLVPVAARASSRALPDIYLFVVDSLRRDYLSPYNPLVTFTPNIDAFAADSYVFRNAFTRHGGTELSIPAIWAGAMMVRGARSQPFHRMNALEKLVTAEGYRVAINDFTVSGHLRPTTPVTTIDPGVPSVQTDLCRNLESLLAYQHDTASDTRPLFGYFAPMNVHILNTRRGGQTSLDGDYEGFYAPYASRLRRIDGCFGTFLSTLKARGRYENSIIIITSDHGESLGEGGYWGHGTWLFPEAVKLPLIVRIPEAIREEVTTDLARVAFSTDIAPTLYALLGHEVRDLGPLFGEPLFVASGRALSNRRRESFLLTSSYGAAFALVRGNGRSLYISDLVEWREFAYDLSGESMAKPVAIDSDLRRLSQRRIREHLSLVSALYRASLSRLTAGGARAGP